MNRLRHAYLEMAPELEPYFITGHHDDIAGIEQTYTYAQTPASIGLGPVLSSTAGLVGVIDAVVAGVLITVVVQQMLGMPVLLGAIAGGVGGVIWLALLIGPPMVRFDAARRNYRSLFPD